MKTLLCVCVAALSLHQAAAQVAEPPARFRILKIIHGVPIEPRQQDELLAKLKAQGFGGFVSNVSFKDYLRSETNWQAFVRIVHEAKQDGMAMWLYDEQGYPSGAAGGLTLEGHPEWEPRGLLIAETNSTGGTVALDLPPGKLICAAAVSPQATVDLTQNLRTATLPAGNWRVFAVTEDRIYEGTHATANVFETRPYINLLRAEPTARFLELTHDAYARRLGNDLGHWFIATFTDEPSLMSLFLRPQPYRVLPWSQDFAQEFQKRRGYALEPVLPRLVAEPGRVRYDFWLTVSELVSQNYFGQIRDWCRRHNIPSGGHLLMEESLLMHVACYGDLFRCERLLDAPSLDCLTSLPPEVPWFAARLVSSAAELEGRADTMCETSDHSQRYRPPGDTRPVRNVAEEEIRGTCNRLILNGMTCITSYYSFHGLIDEQLNRLNLWIGRCCATLYGGHQATDIAMLYPIESVWPKFEPSRHSTKDAPAAAQQMERVYRASADQLFQHRRDFTFIDAHTLAEADVVRGELCHRDLRWRIVVLPAADTLPLKAWKNLYRFWRSGGTVIAIGARPTNSETEFPSPAVQAIAKEMFDGPRAAVLLTDAKQLPAALDRLLPPVTPADAPLRITRRHIGGKDVFFLINDSPQPWTGTVSLPATGPGEQLDPGTGARIAVKNAADLRVELAGYGALLFQFNEER